MRTRIYKKSIVALLRKAQGEHLSMYQLADALEVEKSDPLLLRVVEKMEADKTINRAMGMADGMVCQIVFLSTPPPEMGPGRAKSMPIEKPSRESFDSEY